MRSRSLVGARRFPCPAAGPPVVRPVVGHRRSATALFLLSGVEPRGGTDLSSADCTAGGGTARPVRPGLRVPVLPRRARTVCGLDAGHVHDPGVEFNDVVLLSHPQSTEWATRRRVHHRHLLEDRTCDARHSTDETRRRFAQRHPRYSEERHLAPGERAVPWLSPAGRRNRAVTVRCRTHTRVTGRRQPSAVDRTDRPRPHRLMNAAANEAGRPPNRNCRFIARAATVETATRCRRAISATSSPLV